MTAGVCFGLSVGLFHIGLTPNLGDNGLALTAWSHEFTIFVNPKILYRFMLSAFITLFIAVNNIGYFPRHKSSINCAIWRNYVRIFFLIPAKVFQTIADNITQFLLCFIVKISGTANFL